MNNPDKLQEEIRRSIGDLRFGNTPQNLYDPIAYILELGGKRMRPLLVLLAYRVFSKSSPLKVMKPALAVEMFHNFTLMHDDIMDKAPLRRGKATVHEKWDANTAILSGDVMLVRTYDLFLDLKGEMMGTVIKRFNNCAAEVCEGQQMDMNFEKQHKVSEKDYIEMIRLKTAVLLGFSLELGALLGGADRRKITAMRNFGINIGLGFQLKDDLLDVYADQHKFGKRVGGDIISNKKTYLLIKALELAKGKVKKELEHWISINQFNEDEKVAAVTALYDRLNIREITEEKISQYFKLGLSTFGKIEGITSAQEELRGFVERLIKREN